MTNKNDTVCFRSSHWCVRTDFLWKLGANCKGKHVCKIQVLQVRQRDTHAHMYAWLMEKMFWFSNLVEYQYQGWKLF